MRLLARLWNQTDAWFFSYNGSFKNIKLWATHEFRPSFNLVLDGRLRHDFLYPPLLLLPHPKSSETLSLGSPVAPFPTVLETISNWPGQTLGGLQSPACQMCACQHATCSGRKPIFYFSLLWEICLFLASVPTHPASHNETKKSFHFPSHLSHLKKKSSWVLFQQLCWLLWLPLVHVFKTTLVSLYNILAPFSLAGPLFVSVWTLNSISFFTTFDYVKESLLTTPRCFQMC